MEIRSINIWQPTMINKDRKNEAVKRPVQPDQDNKKRNKKHESPANRRIDEYA